MFFEKKIESALLFKSKLSTFLTGQPVPFPEKKYRPDSKFTGKNRRSGDFRVDCMSARPEATLKSNSYKIKHTFIVLLPKQV